jgi:DNA polymerase I-like protein with 3'-5' exonuclease and polymerase domains
MRYLTLDVETTISNKGNPFDRTNKLCYVGTTHGLYDIEYSDTPYRDSLGEIQNQIETAETLVGFNIKFDLHWLKRYQINFDNKRIWDCQLVHFILTGQTETYPSLNKVCAYYNLESKLDVVSEEYWKNKIDTPDIPEEILKEYLAQDIKLTEQVYLKQLEQLETVPHLKRLVSLHNQDLLVLQEMEYNGILYNVPKSIEEGDKLENELDKIDEWLYAHHNCPEFNPNSTDHLSAFLYGGTIILKRRVAVGTFKTGTRAGQPKERWEEYPVNFQRLVNPLKGSELAKEGLYSTDENTLRSLRGSKKAKEIIETLLFRSTLEKRLSTYYRGLVTLIKDSNWDDGMIYGQLNQCVARTGRLSSSKPNLQNFDGEIKDLFGSRYATAS